MPIYCGGSKISEIYSGGASIKEVYNGSSKVFSSGGAVIEYGKFETTFYTSTITYHCTFLPNFETSTTQYTIFKPISNNVYNAFDANNTNTDFTFLSYSSINAFSVQRNILSDSATFTASNKGTVDFNGIKLDEYLCTYQSGSESLNENFGLLFPRGFVLNKSWFLMKSNTPVSRQSDFGYVISTFTYKLVSRYTVNLLTGE